MTAAQDSSWVTEAAADYEALRDHIIATLNPPDDDAAEIAILMTAIDGAVRFIESAPCVCPPEAAPPDHEADPCDRCATLGRILDARVCR